ncbi:MAG: sigma-54-dependent Fis family transcriptional regulator [Micavibrio aeruginosavorus]|uniref:Sigma-54-dependent Fis family transcriptional regulator n=1 Tax=Micavibrio aeruginosavorus TaxID=349221 RepID=A0A7T5UHH2_9BACT|nr:MAG: sigma-54-dependent Fis family transcriptional regulator [Micavibrio aeruginosavorus]
MQNVQEAPRDTLIMEQRRETTSLENKARRGKFIGTSARMQVLYEQIAHAARSQAPVFITGETGTGKDICAEAIHRYSPRQNMPFITVNCAMIDRDHLESELFGHVQGAFPGALNAHTGAIRMADGGTLFLDDITDMNPETQGRLLHFLQYRSFSKIGSNETETASIRIVCATSRNPLTEVGREHLREDLFFRLHVIPIEMPALRERGDDVLDIAYALLKRYNREEGRSFHDFSADVRAFFRNYSWPGNIRQLQNVIRYICVMHDSDLVTAALLPRALLHRPQDFQSARGSLETPLMPVLTPPPQHENEAMKTSEGTPLAEPFIEMKLADIERYVIENTVSRMAGNIPQAAAHLGVAPSTLYRKRLAWAPATLKNPENPPSMPQRREG